MIKIKSYLKLIIDCLCSNRAIVSFMFLTLVFKMDVAFRGQIQPWSELICDMIVCMSLAYACLIGGGTWDSPTTICDSQYELEHESRSIYYKRFLLFYDLVLFLFVWDKIFYIHRHYYPFNLREVKIIIVILSILVIGKLLFNRPDEKPEKHN